MLLTITTTHTPATDLGYLLHKNPSRFQSFELPFGKAHVFYPEATPERCTVWHGNCDDDPAARHENSHYLEGVEKSSQVRGGELMDSERDSAIRLARGLYEEEKNLGTNFDNGPCLSEEIIPNWCVDIVHVPRQPVDDLPENQCTSYRSGRVKHFVELDTDGNVIRAV